MATPLWKCTIKSKGGPNPLCLQAEGHFWAKLSLLHLCIIGKYLQTSLKNLKRRLFNRKILVISEIAFSRLASGKDYFVAFEADIKGFLFFLCHLSKLKLIKSGIFY